MVQLSRCGARGSLGGEEGEGDLAPREDEGVALVVVLDEGGEVGPLAGEALGLGGEGLGEGEALVVGRDDEEGSLMAGEARSLGGEGLMLWARDAA